MIRSDNEIFKNIKKELDDIPGEIQVINGDFLTSLNEKDINLNHCCFQLEDFSNLHTYDSQRSTPMDDGSFFYDINYILNCRLSLTVYGETNKVLNFLHEAKLRFLHPQYMWEKIPQIRVKEIKDFGTYPVDFNGVTITGGNLVFDCVVEDVFSLENTTIEKVNFTLT